MLLELQGLSKTFAGLTALSGVSFELAEGTTMGIIGPNGAGKTTLLRLLMGFLRPSGGWARIDGRDCFRQSYEVHQRTAYLPGEPRLFRYMRGRSVLRFFADLRGDDWSRSEDIAEQLELNLARRVAFMSTGMRQKLALAATFAVDAPLLILDEPTSNLDPTVRGVVSQLVRQASGAGRTVLFSSHVLSEVEETCDRVAILRSGRLALVQSMDELRRRTRIRAKLQGSLIDPPAELELRVECVDGRLSFETDRPLPPVLEWLARLPLDDVQIDSVGLRSIYDQCFAEEVDA